MEYYLNFLSILVDPFTVCVFIYIILVEVKNPKMNPYFHVAFVLATIGLAGEVAVSFHNLIFGYYPLGGSIPWWIGKDFGYFLIAIGYIRNKTQQRIKNANRASDCGKVKPNE